MRTVSLKTFLQRGTAAVFTLVLLILAACGEDEPKVDPVKVQFNAGNPATITEDGGAKVITLSLSSAAKKNGTITLSATPANANTFATFPATITVTKGSTSAQFTVTPINNAIIDAAAKVITFTLEDPTSGFELGMTTTHMLTITDDEGPTTANFNVTTGTVSENSATGIEVVIGLSPAAEVAGSIEVTMTPAAAAVTTTPAATTGKITVPVTVGQTSVSFKVVPVDNEDDGEDLEIAFEITGAAGGVNVGTNVDFTLTVNDDDDIVPTDIADVRALYTASDVTINTETYIEGVVISNGNNVTNRNVFVQDETGVIVVRFAVAHSFVQGDKLLIDLNGALLTRDAGAPNTGPLQVGGTTGIDATTKATKTGTGTVPAAEIITIEQLNSGAFEGKYVQLETAEFIQADGILKLNGSRTLKAYQGTAAMTVVRTESYAPWQNNLIPLGPGVMKGIASTFNNVAQLIPLAATDIFANNPVGTITIDNAPTDFGSVNNGGESTVHEYTVNGGAGFTEVIYVTASAGFLVSSNNTHFSESTDVPNMGGTVYVKFAPTTGSDQVINGTITHKSGGVAAVTINVSGTETGNGASARQTLALWTFETSAPVLNNSATITGILAEDGLQANTATASGSHASADTDYSSPAGNGSAKSFSSNTWASGDYYQFSLSSTGFSDIKITWDQMGSNTGPASFILQYSTDGTNFTQYGTALPIINDAWSATTPKTTSSYSADLSAITSLNNATTLFFRITVATGSPSINGGVIATGGTGRVDNVKVEGR